VIARPVLDRALNVPDHSVMRYRRLIPALIAIGTGMLLVRLWPAIIRRGGTELRWRSGRLRTAIRSRIEPRVSIVADMGRPPHQATVWTGFASEAEEVRSQLPAEFGRTRIVPER
jgi:hypothetical protein